MSDQDLLLVINSGSSSIKFKLFSFPSKRMIVSGQVERIGQQNTEFKINRLDKTNGGYVQVKNHQEAFRHVNESLLKYKVIKNIDEISIVGHRVVHGGKRFKVPVVINEEVKHTIEDLAFLAPLHNPANLTGIISAEKVFKHAIHVAVFDTAFHTEIPDYAHTYALPKYLYEDEKIRVYGFHGTSHKYVSNKWYELNKTTKGKLITLHLGNGCSMAAVKDGKCVDTSLGFSPTTGLIMGTRCGDLDPMVVLYLIDKLGMNIKEVNDLLNKQSGMLGLTGKSDLRDIIESATNGDKACQLALMMNYYRIKKYIGAYAAAMNGLDSIIFTAGIGENSIVFRQGVLEDLDYLGLNLDIKRNKIASEEPRVISPDNSNPAVWVIPTDEELEIATQSYKLL